MQLLKPEPLPEKDIQGIIDYLTKDGTTASAGIVGKWFLDYHCNDLLFCSDTQTWYYWNTNHWKIDTTLHVEALLKTFIQRLWSSLGSLQPFIREPLSRQLKYCDSKGGITSIIFMARTDSRIKIQHKQLNTHLQFLNCSNGTVDLTTGNIYPSNPKDLITKLIPTDYTPTAESNLWSKFLDDCTGRNQEMIEHLQRAVGSSLSGIRPDNKFFLIQGPSWTGKTTFIETIRIILSDYAQTTGFSTFTLKKYRNDPSPEMVDLDGSRIVVASESNPGERLDSAIIKQYTSKEPIKTRLCYSNTMVDVIDRGKLWFITNHFPSFTPDDAMFNRLVPIKFDQIVHPTRQDRMLLEKLTDKTNAPGILSWCIKGAVKWNRDHQWNNENPEILQRDPLKMTLEMIHTLKELRSMSNPLRKWLDDRMIIDPGNKQLSLKVSVAHNDYANYCVQHDMDPIQSGQMKICLESEGIIYKKESDARYYIGIALKTQT